MIPEALSTLPATREQRIRAAIAVVASASFFAIAAPFAQLSLAPVPAFIPVYQSALVICDLITAGLLFGQLRFFRSRGLLALACGYLLSGLLASVHGLTFPGLFSATGLLGAGPQTTAWIFMFWHGAFPLFVIAYARGPDRLLRKGSIEKGVAATIALAAVLALAATAGHDALPPIMAGNRYTPLMLGVVAAVWLLSFAALALLWRRQPHTVLDVCLMVVAWACIFDIGLSAVFNAARFDLGFYAGRAYGLLAATLVLLVLIVENGKLYRRLREKNVQLELARRAAHEAERAKGAFLACMSHEIRTPMNGAMGMLELLSLTKLDAQQRATLAIVRESSHSLLRIVDDILDFSRIEAGKLELRAEPVSIRALVERVRGTHAGNARAKGLALSGLVDDRISPAIGDAMRLGQVLDNFVSNAVKFTESGAVTLRAELVERRETAEVVRFSVADTGIGMSPSQVDRLFRPFEQVGRPGGAGSGLGLSICHQLAQLMHAQLLVQSAPGTGTTMSFTVELPSADGERIAPVAASQAFPVSPVQRTGRRILVVDDHPVNRVLLVKQLEILGYASESASDGRGALDRWAPGAFDAVITDCEMPGMTGYELATRIREREVRESASRVPIVACTANAMPDTAVRCKAAGMDHFMPKPVSLEQLGMNLARWLSHPGPIDPTAVAELSGGNARAEREVLARFGEYNRGDSRELARAVAERDAGALVRAAHRISGSSRAVGAEPLAQACETLEHAGRAGDWAGIAAALPGFERELERLHAHLVTLGAPS